ncbi:MAG: hypothetical protein VX278_03320 [Myxococcota bacterium]|nr:hypothetical protein [Myxococcota bacterium]
MWLLWVLSVWAEDGSDHEPAQKEPLGHEERLANLHALWSQKDVDSLIEQAEALQLSGQFLEAQELIDFLLQEHSYPYVHYLWAQNQEYKYDYEVAIDTYSLLLKQNIDPALAIDVSYRLGVALDENGEHKKAIRRWKALMRSKYFPSEHKTAIQLLIGAAQIHDGQSRRGVRTIHRALPKATKREGWMQARARNALAMLLIEQADAILLQGKTVQRQVEKRMELLEKAEAQVVASLELDKTEYVLEGVIQVVDAYLRMYDDAISIASPVPLLSVERSEYQEELKKKAAVLKIKAQNYARKGLNYALQRDWQGREKKELSTRIKALKKES